MKDLDKKCPSSLGLFSVWIFVCLFLQKIIKGLEEKGHTVKMRGKHLSAAFSINNACPQLPDGGVGQNCIQAVSDGRTGGMADGYWSRDTQGADNAIITSSVCQNHKGTFRCNNGVIITPCLRCPETTLYISFWSGVAYMRLKVALSYLVTHICLKIHAISLIAEDQAGKIMAGPSSTNNWYPISANFRL